jgi:hypothetical protein
MVKLFLCLIKRHAKKTCGELEGELHAFLTLTQKKENGHCRLLLSDRVMYILSMNLLYGPCAYITRGL